jgi:hypothetical protein
MGAATHFDVEFPKLARVSPVSSRPFEVTEICVKSADDGSTASGNLGAEVGGMALGAAGTVWERPLPVFRRPPP